MTEQDAFKALKKSEGALNYLIGQVLKALPTANPALVREMIRERLNADES